MSGMMQSVSGRIAALYTNLATGVGAQLVGYARTAVNAASRTLFARLGDHVSAADFLTVNDAVADVYTNGGKLWVPRGNFAAAASIPHLHDIAAEGPGAITRAGKTWYVDPFWNQTNTLYVDPAGNDTNDGLDPANAIQTLARAYAILATKGPWLNGTWVLQLAAGTYAGNATFPQDLRGLNPVLIVGPVVNHPNTPTAVIDGANAATFGFNFNGGNVVTLSNVKVINCTTYAVVAQDLCRITTINVHADNIPGGPAIKAQQSRLRVQGGKLNAAQVGISCIAGTTFTVGDPAGASLAGGTIITNCTQGGMLAQEQSSGHADFVTITNCAVGLDATVHSRYHAAGCAITGNATAGVRCTDASSWYDNGTSPNFSGNGVNEIMYAGCGEIGREGPRTSETRGPIDIAFVTQTGSTAVATLKTYATAIAANSFSSQIKGLRVVIYGEITGTLGTKNLTVQLAGSPVAGFTAAAGKAGSYIMETMVNAQSGTAQSYRSMLQIDQSSDQLATGSRSIAMMTGAPIPLTITAQLGNAADTLTVRGVELYYFGGC